MTDPELLIEKYYAEAPALRQLLLTHSRAVADMALALAAAAPSSLQIDTEFLEEAAMLHDIGIIRTHAPGILCFGTRPYLAHGIEGRAILEAEGLPRHALVCERHTGSGLTAREIADAHLPLPERDMLPLTVEEKLICYADKFFSKSSDPRREKSLEEVRADMARFGAAPLARFEALHTLFTP